MPIGVTESTFLIATSVVMSFFVIANAYVQKQQFYPSVVYITKSNASMAVSTFAHSSMFTIIDHFILFRLFMCKGLSWYYCWAN